MISWSTFAQDHQAYLQQGRSAYEKQNFDEALNAYNQLDQQGYTSFELYYNLGNTHYKLGDLPNAILYYEKAKKINGGDEDLLFNLGLANSKITDKVTPLPTSFQLADLYLSLSTDTWAVISLLGFLAFLGTLFMFFYSAKVALKRIYIIGSITGIIVSIWSFIAASQTISIRSKQTEAIVFSPSVTARSAPSESGNKLFIIHEGLKVEVQETSENYSKIKMADGNVGWIKSEALKMI